MLKTASLYFQTIIHLRPIQIYYQLYYRIRSVYKITIGFQYPQFIYKQGYSLALKPSISSNQSYFPEANEFIFLNQKRAFVFNQIDWNDEQNFGKLWVYNLNYFEFLNQDNLTKSQGLALIRQYIHAYPKLRVGSEPYPTSLRNINWIKFLSKYQVQDVEIDGFLMAQFTQIIDSLEYHLMGNHLLENGFSLLFGAYYFKNEQFFKVSNQILRTELSEQILADGGHFERSPMYHQIVLFRLLDCLNLIENNVSPSLSKSEIDSKILIRSVGCKMLSFLNLMTFKNGDIPLVNDAAKHIAPTTEQIVEYANQLKVKEIPVKLTESGYRKFDNATYELLVDVGDVTPDYQPAHAHCNTLSFVLYVNQKPFIVDTGTSTYENNIQRQKERSTSSHNTVQIGDFEQSEIWNSFRVGRRAKAIVLSENNNQITASHNGYRHLGIIHERSFIADNQQVIIYDKIVGTSKYSQKAYLHFHPNVEIQIEGNCVITSFGNIIIENYFDITVQNYLFSDEFNKRISAKMITLFFNTNLTTTIKFNRLETPHSDFLLSA